MQKVIVNITMSLDGFISGPDITRQDPMGHNGRRLHDWLFKDKTDMDATLLNNVLQTSGAVIVGSRTYVTAIEDAWEGVSPFPVPAFVLCHKIPEIKAEGFSFVTEGIASALDKAKAVAGDKNIWVMGGANIIQQYLQANFIDEIHIHIAAVLFCNGTRLFDFLGTELVELRKIETIDTPAATHIEYEVCK